MNRYSYSSSNSNLGDPDLSDTGKAKLNMFHLTLPTTTILTFFLQKKMFRLKPNFLYIDTSTSS